MNIQWPSFACPPWQCEIRPYGTRHVNAELSPTRTYKTWASLCRYHTVDIAPRRYTVIQSPTLLHFAKPQISFSDFMFSSFFRGALAPSLSFTKRRLLATVASDLAGIASIRRDWTRQEIQKIYDGPLLELVFRAATIHRQNHHPGKIQLCTLMNIKSMISPLYLPDPF